MRRNKCEGKISMEGARRRRIVEWRRLVEIEAIHPRVVLQLLHVLDLGFHFDFCLLLEFERILMVGVPGVIVKVPLKCRVCTATAGGRVVGESSCPKKASTLGPTHKQTMRATWLLCAANLSAVK